MLSCSSLVNTVTVQQWMFSKVEDWLTLTGTVHIGMNKQRIDLIAVLMCMQIEGKSNAYYKYFEVVHSYESDMLLYVFICKDTVRLRWYSLLSY